MVILKNELDSRKSGILKSSILFEAFFSKSYTSRTGNHYINSNVCVRITLSLLRSGP